MSGLSPLAWSACLAAALVGCSRTDGRRSAAAGAPETGGAPGSTGSGGTGPGGGAAAAGGGGAAPAAGGGGGTATLPGPDCVHPPVTATCEAGLCTIPAGCFVIGIPRDSLVATPYSTIETEVELTHAFLIGETEVTRAQWLALGLPEPRVDWVRAFHASAPDVAPEGWDACLDADCPVLWVSFEDAAAYTNLLSERQGLEPCYLLDGCVRGVGDNLRCESIRINADSVYHCPGYRLPTEAEWEYAAKAGTRTDYYSGNIAPESIDSHCNLDPNLDAIGWYCGNSLGPATADKVAGGQPHPVAQKRPNGFGLYDMSGNAAEWCNDRYHPLGYGTGRQTDPLGGGTDPLDLTSPHAHYGDAPDAEGFPMFRTSRGGSFDFWPTLAVSGKRSSNEGAGQYTGFRVVRTLGLAAGGSR